MKNLIVSLVAFAALSSVAQAADARRGKDLFMKAGCYQCHGTVGQGANTGPRLGPDPLPLESFVAFVRNASATAMPPYSANMVSDAEMADIHAYLASVAKPPARKDVPLLNNR
jgi:ubiquinol-cytochrome c reductase cytochrome c subunit